VKGEGLGIVNCRVCKLSFTLGISALKVVGSKYQRGVSLQMKEDYPTRVGSKDILLKKGASYKTGLDRFGLISNQEGVVLLEIPFPVKGCQDSVLLAAVPEDFLEEVPSEKVL
jgi:hypothetical protein